MYPSPVPSALDEPAVASPAPRRALLAAVLAGLVAATVVPLGRPGLGWLLAGVAVLVAVLASSRRGAWSPARIGSALAVQLLLAAGTLRAAGWLFLLCLAVAVPFASFAVAGGGRTWLRLARAATDLPFGVPAGLAWAIQARPLTHGPTRARQLGLGLAVGVPVLLVFGGLFASADPVFAKLVQGWTPRLTLGDVLSGALLFAVAGALTLAAARLRAVPPADPAGVHAEGRRLLDRFFWVVPLALLDLLFGVFVWVQIDTLFGGHHYVMGPGGPTFAEYARSGFWQLTLVTLLSLGIVTLLAYRAARESRADRVLIRVLVGLLCLLTLVIVDSALARMVTYVQAYGFTRARLLGYSGELALGAVIVLVIVAGVRLRGGWLPWAVSVTVLATVLGLVVVNPDALIARTIIGRYHTDGHLDAPYLSGLSADAVPEIDTLPGPLRNCILGYLPGQPSTVDSWYAFNVGRRNAWTILHSRPAGAVTVDCTYVIDPGTRHDG